MSGVRRLSVLVEGLPPDSALARDGSMWTQADELAALAIERSELWSQITVGMWAAKASKLPDAIAITHPDRLTPAPQSKKPAGPAQIARLFAGR